MFIETSRELVNQLRIVFHPHGAGVQEYNFPRQPRVLAPDVHLGKRRHFVERRPIFNHPQPLRMNRVFRQVRLEGFRNTDHTGASLGNTAFQRPKRTRQNSTQGAEPVLQNRLHRQAVDVLNPVHKWDGGSQTMIHQPVLNVDRSVCR